MEIFAIFKTAPRIRKLITHGDLQDKIAELANSQIGEFMAHDEAFPFDGQYKPDTNEALVIEGFDDIDGIIETLNRPDDCITWKPKDDTPVEEIKGLFFGIKIEGKHHVGIQNFDRRQIISNKILMGWSGNSFKMVDDIALSLDTKICAVLKEKEDGSTDLYFKSLHNIRRIFDMDAYYHAATIEEIQTFFGSDNFANYDHAWLSTNIDDSIRKTVTYISKEKILENTTPAEINHHAQTVGLNFELVTIDGQDRLQFPKEKRQLKSLLRFLDEDIYVAPFTNRVYVTNSKRRMAGH